jgi:hypothetical protein
MTNNIPHGDLPKGHDSRPSQPSSQNQWNDKQQTNCKPIIYKKGCEANDKFVYSSGGRYDDIIPYINDLNFKSLIKGNKEKGYKDFNSYTVTFTPKPQPPPRQPPPPPPPSSHPEFEPLKELTVTATLCDTDDTSNVQPNVTAAAAELDRVRLKEKFDNKNATASASADATAAAAAAVAVDPPKEISVILDKSFRITGIDNKLSLILKSSGCDWTVAVKEDCCDIQLTFTVKSYTLPQLQEAMRTPQLRQQFGLPENCTEIRINGNLLPRLRGFGKRKKRTSRKRKSGKRKSGKRKSGKRKSNKLAKRKHRRSKK